MMHLRIWMILAVCFAFWSTASKAVWLVADVRDSSADNDTLQKFKVEDFLVPQTAFDRQSSYKLNFNESAGQDNKIFIDILYKSIDVSDDDTNRQIANEFAKFSDVCNMKTMGVYMSISKIGKLETKMANVKDPRRISSFGIMNCIKPMPENCDYTTDQSDGSGLDFSYLIQVIKECHLDLQTAKDQNPEAFVRFQSTSAPQYKATLFPR